MPSHYPTWANIADLVGAGSAVTSVAGRTGDVVIGAADIDDASATGVAILTASDASAVRTLLNLEPGTDIAELSAGRVPVARLGSGTATSSKLLDGSGAWRTLTNSDMPPGVPILGGAPTTGQVPVYGTSSWIPTSPGAANTLATLDSSGLVPHAQLGSGSSGWLKYGHTWSTPTYTDVGAAAATHYHAASDITSGTLAGARLGLNKTASDKSSSDNLIGTSTDIAFAVTSGKTYLIQVRGVVSAAASTNGIRLSMQQTGGATSSRCAGSALYAHASGIAAEPVSAAGAWTGATTGSAAETGLVLDLTYVCTASGTLTLWIRPETNGSAVTLHASSMYAIIEV